MGPDSGVATGEDARTRVFLSYSRKDAALVQRVAEGLMAAGFLPDFDQAAHDPGNVSAGIAAEDEWWKRLQEMIASADVMVFLVSPDSAASAVCDEEIAYARALGKRILAVMARPVDFARAPPRLSALNVRIDFSDSGPGFDAALAALVSALEMNVGWHRDGRKYFARVQEWDAGGRPKSRLLREGAVEEAERWALARPRNEPEPGEMFLAWIAASRAQIRRDAAVRAFWRRVTAVFVLTTLAAVLVGAWFVVSGQRNLGRSESLMLARTSEQFAQKGDYLRALHLAILASRETFLAPTTDEAKAAFAKSAQALRLVQSVQVSDDPDTVIVWAETVAGGRNLLLKTNVGTAELWSLETGLRLAQLSMQDDATAPEVRRATGGTFALVVWPAGAYGVNLETGATFGPIVPETVSLSGQAWSVPAPDGSVFLLVDQPTGVSLRDGTTGERLAVLGADGTTANGVDISADGRIAAVASQTTISFWDLATQAQIGVTFAAPATPLWSFRLSPDGGRMLVWAVAGDVSYVDILTGESVWLEGIPEGGISDAIFTRAPDRLVALLDSRQAQIYETQTGAAIGGPVSFDPPRDGLESVVKDGVLLSASYLTGLRPVSLETGEVLNEPFESDPNFSQGVLLPGGKGYIAWDGRQVVSRMASGYDAPVNPLVNEHPGFVEQVVVSPDGRMFLTYTGEGEVHQWETETGLEIGKAVGHKNFESYPGYLGAGDRMLTLVGGRAQVWRTRGFTVAGTRSLPDGEGLDNSLMSPDGRFLLAWNLAGRAMLWDLAAGKAVGPGLLTGEQGYWGAEFNPGGTQLALWFENQLQLIDTSTGVGDETLLEHQDVVTNGVFTEDGTRLVTVDVSQTAYVWDVDGKKRLGDPQPYQGYGAPPIDAVRKRMVTYSGAQARLVDLATGALIGEPKVHVAKDTDPAVIHAAFSANGDVVLTWNPMQLHVWEAANGAARTSVNWDEPTLWAAAVSPDGSRMLAIHDNRVEAYDISTGEMIGAPFALQMQVNGAALSSDGRLAATWGDDTMLRLWTVETGERIGDAYQTGLVEQEAQFTADDRRLLVTEPAGAFRIVDTATGDVITELTQSFYGGKAKWDLAGGRLVTQQYQGDVQTWDIADALRTDAAPKDIAEVCAAKLSGTPSAGVPFVRRLDAWSTSAAPILRGREGEDVCTAPPVAWWEQAAGVAFGWMFR